MNINERRLHLVEQINSISDEKMLMLIEDTMHVYAKNSDKDITSGLSENQLKYLNTTFNESDEQNIVSETEFDKLLERWNTK